MADSTIVDGMVLRLKAEAFNSVVLKGLQGMVVHHGLARQIEVALVTKTEAGYFEIFLSHNPAGIEDEPF